MSSSGNPLLKAHFISGTHWDREWYRPFQEFRILLADILDDLLTLLEKETDFRYFQLDGQTCLLQDYLDVRPENEARLKTLIEQRRILIGPWFTMPDLFAPGEEALIRNLLLGLTISKEWNTNPLNAAYTCDMFGHPEQMPQIYKGFELNNCVLGRGTNEHSTPAFFNWQGPDGSEVTVFKLQDYMGYGAFSHARNLLGKQGKANDADTLRKAEQTIADYISHETNRSDIPLLCLIDAIDHQPPAADVEFYLNIIKKTVGNINVKHSTLENFFDELHSNYSVEKVITGELREPAKEKNPYNWLIPNCTSSRVRLKIANDRCEMLLQRLAEPLSAAALADGFPVNDNVYFRKAWELLLLNHAHDSICGCSVDQVHRDMQYRYEQVDILAKQLANRAFANLTDNCKELASEKDEFTLILYNPLPFQRKEVFRFPVDLPADFPAVFTEGFPGSQNISSFTISDSDGNTIPYQRLSIKPIVQEPTRLAVTSSEGGDGEFSRYIVAAELTLPPAGYRALLVKPSNSPVRRLDTMRTGALSAANEFIEISIQSDGTLSLYDLELDQWYHGLLRFEDTSEIGSGWFHSRTANDEHILSTQPAVVSVLNDGPEVVVFRVLYKLTVPASYDWRLERRSASTTEILIDNHISLWRGKREITVETTVTNTAEDHCLRLLLPTGLTDTQSYRAHTPFAMTERKIALKAETSSWREAEIPEKPFRHLLRISDEKRGLAFISAGGLHEGAVRDDNERTMQITMLRSFRRTVGTSGQPDGLEKGEIHYSYAIVPVTDSVPDSELLYLQQAMETGSLMTRQSGKLSSGFAKLTNNGCTSKSFFGLKKKQLVLSAVKAADNGKAVIIRLWNPAQSKMDDELIFDREIESAGYMLLSEKETGEAVEKTGAASLRLTADRCSIITVKVIFRN
jgi:alpha-mannosidase